VAVVFYGLTLLTISVLMGALWAAAARDRDLLRPEVGQAEVDDVLRATTPSVGFFVLATAVAIVAPHVAAFGYLVIAIALVATARGDEPRRDPSERVSG
jgi:hypothetical protein